MYPRHRMRPACIQILLWVLKFSAVSAMLLYNFHGATQQLCFCLSKLYHKHFQILPNHIIDGQRVWAKFQNRHPFVYGDCVLVRFYMRSHSKFYLHTWITFLLKKKKKKPWTVYVKYSELATGWTYEKSWFNSGQVHEISKAPTMALGPTQALLQWVQLALSSGIKQPEHEADHPSSSHAEVNNECSHTFIPPYAFIASIFYIRNV